jgi:hypothetical protein
MECIRDVVIGLTGLCAGLTLMLVACGSPAPQTNAEKCQAMGGAYNSAARTCTFQAE